ncbi:hypothetical protein B0T21DRAFT_425143 [Apiosordaria backusii]|uniref:IBR domain-containing protein n=1 Tax=Apiosordaria backusii TaxID=314023 RepID=A0AA40AN86_9PEZI|nr:hypothetical protein B0T21DRAFT_425143 [Apiosordaria backusii]
MPPLRTTYDCTICLTPFLTPNPPFPPTPIPTCGHHHCPKCLTTNLTLSLKTLPFRPATCCSQRPGAHIPPSIFRRLHALPSETITLYRQKLTEYESLSRPRPRDIIFHPLHNPPPTRRILSHHTTTATYCHDPQCSTFIPDILAGKCRKCKKRTCVECKERFHLGEGGCKQQEDLDAPAAEEQPGKGRKVKSESDEREMWELTKELMREMGWRRCPGCRAGVEKTEGCNHMYTLDGIWFLLLNRQHGHNVRIIYRDVSGGR